MKLLRLCLALVVSALAFASAASGSDGRVYELRTYTATPGNLPAVISRFREHTVKIFERQGMENIGYWTPMDEKDGAADKLVYLLAHKNRDAAKASWKSFGADPKWQEVRKQTEANGKIVAKVDSIYLTPADYSKMMDAGNGKAARVFELRSYTAPEGKLAALDSRFRDHTLKLFAKHGMTNLGYFHPADADKGAANTLIYFLAHASREAAAASWKGFREDPEWQKVLTESQKDGKLTTKVESVVLKPVDFSRLK
jgi:hypothetical protein